MGGKQAKLKADVVDDLIRSTPFSEQEIHSWYRGFLTDCPSGQLNLDDFQRLYCALFNHSSAPNLDGNGGSCYGDPRPFARLVFRAFDQNGDGIVEFRDIITTLSLTGTAAGKEHGEEERRLHWAFSAYDLDGDGYISRAELLQVVSAIYTMIGPLGVFKIMEMDDSTPEQRAARLFEVMDVDGDDRISLEDFIASVRADSEIMQLLLQHPTPPPNGLDGESNYRMKNTPQVSGPRATLTSREGEPISSTVDREDRISG